MRAGALTRPMSLPSRPRAPAAPTPSRTTARLAWTARLARPARREPIPPATPTRLRTPARTRRATVQTARSRCSSSRAGTTTRLARWPVLRRRRTRPRRSALRPSPCFFPALRRERRARAFVFEMVPGKPQPFVPAGLQRSDDVALAWHLFADETLAAALAEARAVMYFPWRAHRPSRSSGGCAGSRSSRPGTSTSRAAVSTRALALAPRSPRFRLDARRDPHSRRRARRGRRRAARARQGRRPQAESVARAPRRR